MFKKKKKNKKEGEVKPKEKNQKETLLPEKIKQIIIGTVLILFAVIISFSFFGESSAGTIGDVIKGFLETVFGKASAVVPVLIFVSAFVYFKTKYKNFLAPLLISFALILTGLVGIIEASNKGLGGWIGGLNQLLYSAIGVTTTCVVFVIFVFAGIVIVCNLVKEDFSVIEVLKKIFSEREKDMKISTIKKVFVSQEKKEEPKEKKEEGKKQEEKEYSETKTRGGHPYLVPPFGLLSNNDEESDSGDTERNASIIKKTFQDFDISVAMGEINVGPAVTQYTLKPAEGVKLSKITSLTDDLALSLAMHPVRTEAPIPGKSLVGIEVPNRKRAKIGLGSLLKNKDYFKMGSLSFVAGKDVAGYPVYTDLAKMPHLLVSGSTGSGKTIFLNIFILSLIYRNSPQDMRLILVDPKRVEFSLYSNLPHLLTSIIYDAERAVNALDWLIGEMERRFKVLAEVGCKNIGGYREIATKKKNLEEMPYIVLVIDELADLMAVKGNEMEAGIVRIAQMARAVGIHLVLATQRPSVEVITGVIKANIISRISFKVASQIDSRTILDTGGAEKLLGSGDMLFVSGENSKPKRIQVPYVSEKEVQDVVSWLKENSFMEEEDVLSEKLEETLIKKSQSDIDGSYGEEDDALYEEAKQLVIISKKASASLLQRRLKVGYARAARLLDMLESNGIVGPSEGAKPREVYETFQQEEEAIPEQNNESKDEEEKGEDDEWKKI
ncbi:MAG: DNA translocase FtsK [Patescibacteria group bacterium]|nr:DNA translocase FtsK [Patescibacteria group bacterium]